MSADRTPFAEHGGTGHQLRRAANWLAAHLAILILTALWSSYYELRHPSTPIQVMHLVVGIMLLAGMVVALVYDLPHLVRGAREVRDWLWLRRQDWRDWRERGAGRPSD
jgi:hypothetical protein